MDDKKRMHPTGSLKGGHAGTRVHPDSPQEREEKRLRALQRIGEGEQVEYDWAVVEKGRTVEAPTGELKWVGYDREGNNLFGPILSTFGPGQKVHLPVPEIKRLQVLGFLVDPDRVHNAAARSQAHMANEPRSRVLRSSNQQTPGPVINQSQ